MSAIAQVVGEVVQQSTAVLADPEAVQLGLVYAGYRGYKRVRG